LKKNIFYQLLTIISVLMDFVEPAVYQPVPYRNWLLIRWCASNWEQTHPKFTNLHFGVSNQKEERQIVLSCQLCASADLSGMRLPSHLLNPNSNLSQASR